MLNSSWPLVIALALLLQGLGKFLDDHHLSSASKDKVRTLIIRAFLVLESMKPPEVARKLISLMTASNHPLFSMRALPQIIIVTITITAVGFQIAYVLDQDFWRLVEEEIYSSDFRIALATIYAIILIVRFIHRLMLRSKYFIVRILGIVLAVMLIGIPTFPLILLIIWLREADDLFEIATIIELLPPFFAFAAPAILLIASLLLFTFIKLTVPLFRKTALYIFDKSSSPSTSPFTYASALIGILVLAAKAVQEGVAVFVYQ